jgi:hypothetical protein
LFRYRIRIWRQKQPSNSAEVPDGPPTEVSSGKSVGQRIGLDLATAFWAGLAVAVDAGPIRIKATAAGPGTYRVMQVTPPKTKSSKWRRREPKPEEKKWRLLVQEVQDGD